MERRHLTRFVLAASVFLTSCAPKGPEPVFYVNPPTPTPDHAPVPTPVGATAISTPYPALPESARNTMTGAVYDVATDPEGKNRQCLKVEKYTSLNPQTVDGAAVALGVDPGIYVDIEGGSIYSRGILIGTFNKEALPDNAKFGSIHPADNIVVCDDTGK